MPDFKNKEEYEKWKAQRHEQGQAQNNRPQGGFVTPAHVPTPSTAKKPLIRVTLISLLLIVLGVSLYVGYLKYEKNKAQEARKKELRLVIQKFREIESALTVGLNKLSYNDRLVNIRIEMDKFENTHKRTVEQQLVESLMFLEKAFEAYNDGKEAWGEDYKISLTNWQGNFFPWAAERLQKYPLLNDKIRKHDFYIDGSTYIIQEIFRNDYGDIIWAYAADYTRKAELSLQ